jgi:flavin reductase (DIM6/NTAB) family NADH-FMN oxidoreductase RutF
VFSPTRRRDSSKKDTLLNVEATGEFVVHAAVASLAEKVNQSSKELPHGESEVELVGLHTVPSIKVKPPRLVESPVAMECKVRQIIQSATARSPEPVIGEGRCTSTTRC